MVDDPQESLAEHGASPVPPADTGFVDRLEAQLRVAHSEQSVGRRRFRLGLPRIALACVLLIAGLIGVMALTPDEAGVPVAVIDDGEGAAAAASDSDAPDPVAPDPINTDPINTDPVGVATAEPDLVESAEVPTATPTATPTSDSTAAPQPSPSAVQAIESAPTPTPTPVPTLSPVPTIAPVPTEEPKVAPTAIQEPTATIVPTLEPTPTSSPAPSPTPERATPEPMVLTCAARVANDLGVVRCEWPPLAVPEMNVTEYQLLRSLNGGDAAVVSRQRANAATIFLDRDVMPGDRASYLVQALAGDLVVGASVREAVEIRE